jgi:hypothetical protein
MHTLKFCRRHKATTKQQLTELLTHVRDDLAHHLTPEIARNRLDQCLIDLRTPPVPPLYRSGGGLTLAGVVALLDGHLAQLRDVQELEGPADVLLNLRRRVSYDA